MSKTKTVEPATDEAVQQAREQLDQHLQGMLQWHFDPATGSPFWLEWLESVDWDPREEVKGFDDIIKFCTVCAWKRRKQKLWT